MDGSKDLCQSAVPSSPNDLIELRVAELSSISPF